MGVDHYFSNVNWEKDEYLRQLSDDQGFVEISQIVTFDRLAQLCTDVKFVSTCLEESDSVEISSSGSHIRRRSHCSGAGSCATPLRAEKKASMAAENGVVTSTVAAQAVVVARDAS